MKILSGSGTFVRLFLRRAHSLFKKCQTMFHLKIQTSRHFHIPFFCTFGKYRYITQSNRKLGAESSCVYD